MRKISLVILSFTFFSSILSQDCNNPLLVAYNLTSLNQPQSGEGLRWCSNLQSGQTCCSSETVNQFQGIIQDLIDSLEEEAGDRDQGLVGLRNSLIDRYQDAVSDLTDNDDELRSISNANSAVGNEIRAQWRLFRNVTDQLSDLDDDDDNDNTDNNTDDDNDFFVYLQNLQVARSRCLNTVLDVQASLWCLACDPNWASQGVDSNGTVVLSDSLSDRLTRNCYNYTRWSQVFNPILIANQTIQRVGNLNDYLRNYRRDRNVLQTASVSDDVYQPINANEKTVALPRDCSRSSCPWQTRLLFSAGSINQDIAANGAGLLGGADAILPDIIQGNVVPSDAVRVREDDLIRVGYVNIVVQSGSNGAAWEPANNQSGIPIDISGDPAQVSGLREGVVPPRVAGSVAGGGAGATAVLNQAADHTDNDGINTDANDPTDNDGINTDRTDNDGINTDANDPTDNDGVNTDSNDKTDNDGNNTDNNDQTDNNSDN